MREPDPALWREVGADLERLREQLRSVPIEDRDTWARVARQTSGAFAAWSARVEETPGPLAATSDALARTAELRRRPVRPERAPKASASGAAMLLISAAKGGRGAVAQAVMLRQLANLAKAVYDMHRADQDARRAAQIERAIRRDLATVSARLPDPGPVGHPDTKAAEVVRTARQAQGGPQRTPGSPVPNRIEPQRPRSTTAAGRNGPGAERDHGVER
ncbi:serine/threonine-protein kinase [Micropruina glycogenica]|uniref:Relaxase/Mobilisation nuclease domain-containing protein n=1 Tax=Micropruina glycogenica TaxID=75385 RepID=A0A2N9JCV1_9ACTN